MPRRNRDRTPAPARRLALERLEARETPAAIGTLDPSFGTAGVTVPLAANRFASVAIQSDGKLVAVANGTAAGGDFFLTRFNPNGTTDTTFGTSGDGTIKIDISGQGQVDAANAVAIDARNRIVVVGRGGAAIADFALVRLSADGKATELNTHFHVGDPAAGAEARAVGFQSDGTIVIAGDAKVNNDRDFAIARVDPSNGTVIGTPVTVSLSLGDDQGNAVAVYPSGPNRDKIVVVGTTNTNLAVNQDIAIVQRNADLSPDTGFNGGTKIIGVSGNDAAGGVAITAGGSIVVVGNNGAADPDMLVAQLLPTGVLDPAFNNGAIRAIGKPGADTGRAVAIQVDGRIVAVGDTAGNQDVGVYRLNPDGTLDASFAGTGDSAFNVSGNDDGNAVAIDSNGRIVIAGNTGAPDGFLARLIGRSGNSSRLAVGGGTSPIGQVFTPAATGQYPAAPATTGNVFGKATTSARVAVGDVNGDGIPDVALVTGPGTPIQFAVLSGVDNTTQLVAPTAPFSGSESFTGGGFVAVADLDNDGRAEVIVSPDQGGGPRVTIFSLNLDGTTTVRANFFGIDDPSFRGGARTAAGDVNGDGVRDLAVAAGFLGGPRVALFDGKTVFGTPTRLIGDFFAFPGDDATRLRNGAFVALGDVNGDGSADLIFGGGPGGAPRVFVLSGQLVAANTVSTAQGTPIANFFVAGNSTDRGGVRVAATDADGDNKADVAVGSGEKVPSRVRVYLGKNFTTAVEPTTFQDLDPFAGATLDSGVFVG